MNDHNRLFEIVLLLVSAGPLLVLFIIQPVTLFLFPSPLLLTPISIFLFYIGPGAGRKWLIAAWWLILAAGCGWFAWVISQLSRLSG